MSGYDIALSGIEAAQRAIELIGTNISNATTEGYHRQELITSPKQSGSGRQFAGGVDITGVKRSIDLLLEREILRQRPDLASNDRILSTLRLIENALGEVDAEGLSTSIDKFFNSLTELAADPGSEALQYQAVWAADGLAGQFRQLGDFVADLREQIKLQGIDSAREANLLIDEIADLNDGVNRIMTKGGNPSAIQDRRDQAITELAQILDVQVTNITDESGMVSVSAWGMPLVVGPSTVHIQVALDQDDMLAVGVEGSNYYQNHVRGGDLGAMAQLFNETISNLQTRLNTLASQFVYRVNEIHAQGVSAMGPMTDATGRPVSEDPLGDWDAWGTELTDGTVRVRITDHTTQQVVYREVSVTAASTLETIAQDFDAFAELDATGVGGTLRIQSADPTRYGFDFLPASELDTVTLPWSGSTPSIRGTYEGENDTLRLTVVGTGAPGSLVHVGTDDTLALEVHNGDGDLLKTVSLGTQYAAGEDIELVDGLTLSMPAGYVALGEEFSINAVSDADTAGLLSAAGINTFFSGSTATNIAVRSEFLAQPKLLATSRTAEGLDNDNLRKMAAIADTQLTELGSLTAGDYFRKIVSDVGQDVAFREAKNEGLSSAMRLLEDERDRVSGVDINEEAAKLIMFEQLFQGAAKYMRTQIDAMEALMQLI